MTPGLEPKPQPLSTPLLIAGIVTAIALAATLIIGLLLLAPGPIRSIVRTPAYEVRGANAGSDLHDHHYREAVREADNMIRLLPERVDGYFIRGNAHMRLHDYQAAIRDYTLALQRSTHPRTRGKLFANRGECRHLLKDEPAAIADLTEALRLNPEDEFALQQRMFALSAARQDDAALRDAEALIRRGSPRAHRGYRIRGLVEGRRKQYPAAMSDLRRATQLAPDSGVNWTNLGWIQYEAGELPEAIQSCRKALALAPANVVARFNLGLCQAASGREAEAREAYVQALRTAPEKSRKAAREELETALQRYPASAALVRKAEGWIDAAPPAPNAPAPGPD